MTGKRGRAGAVLLSFLLVLLGAEMAAAQTESAPGQGAKAKVIIKYKTKPGKAEKARLRERNGAKIRFAYDNINAIAVTIPRGQLKAVGARKNVKGIEIDHPLVLFDHAVATGDPELEQSWGVEHTGAGRVHATGNLGDPVRAAVIDTGIYCAHADIGPNCDGGVSYIPGVTWDDDHGHGTHVSEILAGVKNGVGIVGMGPHVKLVGMKVLDSSGEGDYSGLIAALDQITTWNSDGIPSNDVDVINMSIGGHETSGALQAAVQSASSTGVILVAASGNVNPFDIWELLFGCPVVYPAAYPEVLATTFTNGNDALTGYSCTGPEIDFTAPGDLVTSSVPPTGPLGSPSGYIAASGTSMASPHLAGTVALVLSHGIADTNGNGLRDEIESHLCANADVGFGVNSTPIPTSDPRYPEYFGCGVIDAGAALVDDPPGGGPPINDPPIVDAGPDVDGAEGDAVALSGSVTDEGSPTIGWSASPDACTFGDPAEPTTTVTCSDDGSYTLTLSADDGINSLVTDTTTLTLTNVAPTVQAGADQAVIDGDLVTVDATFSDPGSADGHSATVDWGEGAGPQPVTPGPGSVSDSHTYADPGSYIVEVAVTDDDGDTGSDTLTVSVDPINDPPIVDAGPDVDGAEGDAVALSGSVTDEGSPTIGWSASPDACTFGDPAEPTTTVTCSDDGSYTLTLSADDGINSLVTDTTTLTLTNVAPTVQAGADQAVIDGDLVTVDATFSDPGSADGHSATVDWGEGAGPQPVTPGPGSVSDSHTYADPGSYIVEVAVTDDDGDTGSDTLTVSVDPINDPPIVDAGPDVDGAEGDAVALSGSVTDEGSPTIGWSASPDACTFGDPAEPTTTVTCSDDGSYTLTLSADDGINSLVTDTTTLTLTNVAPTVQAGADQAVIDGDLVTVDATFSDPGSADGHSATVDWGEGAGPQPVTPGPGSVSDSHTYADPGSYIVEVAVTDDDGDTGSDTLTVSVDPINDPPIVDAGPDVDGAEGDAVALSGSVTDEGSPTIGWSASPDACTFGDPAEPTTTVTCSDDGSYTLTLSADDGINSLVTDTTTLTLTNVAPTVQAGADQAVIDGDLVTVDATFSDPGSADGHSATVDWGEGAGPQPVTPGPGSVSDSHTYADPGSYIVEVAVTDDDGDTGSDTLTVSVDPINTSVMTFTAGADAHVNSRRANRNYGSSKRLQVRDGHFRTFVGFAVAGVDGAVKRATLRLYLIDAGGVGTAYQVTQPWSEDSVTWGNQPAPAADPYAATNPSAPSRTWVEFDVTAAVSGNGSHDFIVTDGSSDTAKYQSREAKNDPELVIEFIPSASTGSQSLGPTPTPPAKDGAADGAAKIDRMPKDEPERARSGEAEVGPEPGAESKAESSTKANETKRPRTKPRSTDRQGPGQRPKASKKEKEAAPPKLSPEAPTQPRDGKRTGSKARRVYVFDPNPLEIEQVSLAARKKPYARLTVVLADDSELEWVIRSEEDSKKDRGTPRDKAVAVSSRSAGTLSVTLRWPDGGSELTFTFADGRATLEDRGDTYAGRPAN